MTCWEKSSPLSARHCDKWSSPNIAEAGVYIAEMDLTDRDGSAIRVSARPSDVVALALRVGLADRERSLPSKLSGGEQQRVAIARALIGEPGLLLADGPTGNLDSVTGADIVQLISDLRTEKDMTVIVATHDPIIASTCERVVTMRDGRVLDHMAIPATEAKDERDTLRGISRLDGSG